MHKQHSCLVQVKDSKRLGGEQLERKNGHKNALKIVNFGHSISRI